MKKVLIFAGSNSSTSLNRKLAGFIAKQVSGLEVHSIDLRDYPLPLYSIDIERNEGIPEPAHQLKAVLDKPDGFIIVVPEHNTSIPAFFKNAIDWVSRIDKSFFKQRPIALFGTSPGPGGARSALAHAEKVLSGYLGGIVVGTLSLPKFKHNTEAQEDGSITINDEQYLAEMNTLLSALKAAALA